jgi:hypothetical protein
VYDAITFVTIYTTITYYGNDDVLYRFHFRSYCIEYIAFCFNQLAKEFQHYDKTRGEKPSNC